MRTPPRTLNVSASPALRRAWAAIGWMGVLILVYGSLTPNPPSIPFEHGDKFEHVAAYGCLMFWFAQLVVRAPSRVAVALALCALGVALEFAQRATAYRTFEWVDMTADGVGVAIGWILAWPRLPNALELLEQHMHASRARM